MEKKLLTTSPFRTIYCICFLVITTISFAQTTQQIFNIPGSGSFTVPAGVTSITVEAWGGGGCGKNGSKSNGSNGGGGGEYARSTFTVTAGQTYAYMVGKGGTAGSDGGYSSFNSLSVVANGGKTNGDGGSGGMGAVTFKGGNGGANSSNSFKEGAGGGSAAGSDTVGNNGINATKDVGAAGGAATVGGGAGGAGGKDGKEGINGGYPGGGGGGGGKERVGGNGGDGQVIITYTPGKFKATIIGANYGSPTWCAGETRMVSVEIRNTGTQDWTDIAPADFNIGVKWNTNGTSWSDYNVRVDAQNLKVNETKTYNLTITASNNLNGAVSTTPGYTTTLAAGNNNLTFDVVYEQVAWFGWNTNGVGPGNTPFITPNINIVALPDTPTAVTGATSICLGNSTNLNGTSTGNTIEWYTTSTGGVPIGTSNSGSNFAVSPTVTTTYYAAAKNTLGCVSSARAAGVTVTVNALPTAPTASAQTFCSLDAKKVSDLIATGTAIKWYSAATAGTLYSGTEVLATRTYYASQTTNGCESARTPVSVTVNAAVTAAAASTTPTLCINTALTAIRHATTGATGIGTAIGLPNGVSAAFASNTITIIGTPTASGTFNYSIPLTGGCGIVSAVGTIIVNNTGQITLVKTDKSCSNVNNGTINTTLSGGLTNVRYIKLTQKYVNADAWQQVQEIQAYEVFTGTNVALSSNGATATASSVYLNNAAGFGPQKAIDGDALGYSFWHSNSVNINEFITIDLSTGKNLDYIRIYNRSDCCQNRGQNMLLELFDASNNLVYSKVVNLWENINGAHFIDVNVLDLSWLDNVSSLSRAGLDSGTYILNYSDARGCSSSATAIIDAASPPIPQVGTPVQPTCNTKGSVSLSGLPSSGTIVQTGTANLDYAITGTTMTISGLSEGTYKFSVNNGSCSSNTTNDVVIKPVKTNKYTSSGWSSGSSNTIGEKIEFDADYNEDTDVYGCSCTINSGKKVTIRAGRTMKIVNEVAVLGTGVSAGTLTFEDLSSLVQTNDTAINTGNITYIRAIRPTSNFDYTYWSTPVAGQTLFKFSPDTLGDKFFSFDSINTNNWQYENPTTTIMKPGVGYIIRGPQSFAASPKPIGFYPFRFVGVPNNGEVKVPIGPKGNSVLIGNPYPSALNAIAFLEANKDLLEGTIYFWTHNTAIQLASGITDGTAGSGTYAYTSNDYAAFNRTGGVATAAKSSIGKDLDPNINSTPPSGFIGSGQSFLAVSLAPGDVIYNNSMRVYGTNSSGENLNGQFYKTASTKNTATNIEKSRIWLDLTNDQGAFKETLLGYITGATNENESAFDGESSDGNTFIDFYSVNKDKNLTIQGRALPFDAAEVVALGYSSAIVGQFGINMREKDGLFTNQKVYLEDKLLGTIFDLAEGTYKFTTEAGTFKDRFAIRYTSKTLGVEDLDPIAKGIVISTKNKVVSIQSGQESIANVYVYDVTGKQLYKKSSIEANQLVINNLAIGTAILVVKVILTNGEVVRQKIVY